MSLFKQVVALALLVLVAGGGYLAWQQNSGTGTKAQDAPGRGAGGPAVEVDLVRYADIETVVEAVGTTRAIRAVEIMPSASGRVKEITFRAGKRVDQGEALLRLDDDIERADLIEADAQLREASTALERARALRRSSTTTQAAVEKLVATLATAQANRDRAARRLRDRTVNAPFAGVVGFTDLEVGARIDTSDTITTLDDLATVEIAFSLPEGLYGQITPGKQVVASATAFPGRTFTGEIVLIDSRVDPVSRAFRARAIVANPDYLLPAGMFMHLSVVLDSRRALTVPEESIVVEGSQAQVFVVEAADGRSLVRRRIVTLGQRAFGSVEILDGVSDGESVVVRGVQKVRDGQPVRPGKPRESSDRSGTAGS
jgi:membrane fusion protein (multidrug efflux system)